jgi:hypothetical protein
MGQYIKLPGWNRVCVGINLITSNVTASVNGQLSPNVTTVKDIPGPNKAVLSNTSVAVISELFTEFQIYSKPIGQIVTNSAGDLMPWKADQWTRHQMAVVKAVKKSDIDSPKETRYLAVASELNFLEAVSNFDKNIPIYKKVGLYLQKNWRMLT